MVDQGIALPPKTVDPVLGAFVLNPDKRLPLGDALSTVAGQSPGTQAWLRERRGVLAGGASLVAALPDIDKELCAALAKDGLLDLFEADLAPTLGAFAKIERTGGAWVGPPSGYSDWGAYLKEEGRRLDQLELRLLGTFRDGDFYARTLDLLVERLRAVEGKLPDSHWMQGLTPRQTFERYVALGSPAAIDLEEARALAGPTGRTGPLAWAERLRTTRRLRGRLSPTVTGRWTFRDPPLHSLVKHGPDARIIRSGLTAPPGFILVGADYNAQEVRLLASLSGSQGLLAAARHDDVHSEVAKLLFGKVDPKLRSLGKLATLSILYGQTRDGFCRSQAALPVSDAGDLHDRAAAALADVAGFSRAVLAGWRTKGFVTTTGGWRRLAPSKRKAFNTIIQGLGADILRWVLRRLDPRLGEHDAFVVHIAHDEIDPGLSRGGRTRRRAAA